MTGMADLVIFPKLQMVLVWPQPAVGGSQLLLQARCNLIELNCPLSQVVPAERSVALSIPAFFFFILAMVISSTSSLVLATASET